MITLDYDCVIDFWNNETWSYVINSSYSLKIEIISWLFPKQTSTDKAWYFLINRSFFFIWVSHYTNINKIFHYVKKKKDYLLGYRVQKMNLYFYELV